MRQRAMPGAMWALFFLLSCLSDVGGSRTLTMRAVRSAGGSGAGREFEMEVEVEAARDLCQSTSEVCVLEKCSAARAARPPLNRVSCIRKRIMEQRW